MGAYDFDSNFRRESARLVARLTRVLGAENLALAEDVAQETFLRAMRTWPTQGVPPNPSAWLARVARNLVIDRLRREGIYAPSESLDQVPASAPTEELVDEELAMLLMCGHPSLPPESQIALTLKVVCGLSVGEIARGLLAREEAVAQRLVRAKSSLRDAGAVFEIPSGERLHGALRVLYLMFNEGYLAASGDRLTKSEVCDEAILLTERLSSHRLGDRPEVHALLALMLLHSSRLPARVGPDGGLRLLEEQDRTLWDQGRIRAGLAELDRASQGGRLTPFHVEAAIAACHATACTYADTDWQTVRAHYDDLVRLAPSAVAKLNRAVAIGMCEGPSAGLKAVAEVADEPKLARYYLLFATRGRFLELDGRACEARLEYERARGLATNEAERCFLDGRIDRLSAVN